MPLRVTSFAIAIVVRAITIDKGREKSRGKLIAISIKLSLFFFFLLLISLP